MSSFFPIQRWRPFDDPFDRYFGNQLDFFDPIRDFDTFPSVFGKTTPFRWINEPRRLGLTSSSMNSSSSTSSSSNSNAITPSFPTSDKFRIQLNVAGFAPDTIQTRVEGRRLYVQAKQEDRHGDDYSLREIRKSYDLPEHADTSQLASFVTPNNQLVVEVPIRNLEQEQRMLQQRAQQQQQLTSSSTSGGSSAFDSDRSLMQWGSWRDPYFDYAGFGLSEFSPKVVDVGGGQKKLQMSVPMKQYRPEQIKVSVKNNDLIVHAESEFKDNNRSERSFYSKQVTLPPGTQLDYLQSHLTNMGELQIEAPYIEPSQRHGIEAPQRQSIEVRRI